MYIFFLPRLQSFYFFRTNISFLDPAIRKLDRSSKNVLLQILFYHYAVFFFKEKKKIGGSYLSVHGRFVNVALRHDIIHDLLRRGPVSLPQIPDGVHHPGRHLGRLLPHFPITSPAFFFLFFSKKVSTRSDLGIGEPRKLSASNLLIMCI